MENLLNKTRLAVEKYHLKQAGDKMKAIRGILSAVLACRDFISEAEREDRGGTQQMARQLSEVLAELPMFRNFALDKKALHNLHTKKLADEHLDMIQHDLENAINEMQAGKKKKIQDWVKSHPVLGKLKKNASRELPQGAYVLLFRRSASLPVRRKGGKKRDLHPLLHQEIVSEMPVPEEAAGGLLERELEPEGTESAAAQTVCLSADEEVGSGPEQEDDGSAGEALDDELPEEFSTLEVVSLELLQGTEEAGGESDSELETLPVAGDEPEHPPENPDEDAASEDAASDDEGKLPESHAPVATTAPRTPSEKTRPYRTPPDLVVRPAADGKVFTRFRPKEFTDDSRLYRMFRGGPPLVGACIIADGKLISAIGVLPQPDEGRDQLRVLLSISKEAVGKPGRDFVESNPVLNELFQLCKSRSVHKDAYILLFQEAQSETGSPEDASAGAQRAADELTEEKTAAPAPVENLESEAASTDEAPAGDAAQESILLESQTGGSGEPQELPEQSSVAGDAPEEEPLLRDLPESQTTGEEPADIKLELVSKKTEDGRIITRYRSFDFSDLRSLYETFKTRPPVVGAAVIREKELIKVIGTVPPPEGSRQLDVLLGVSRRALEKPALEFIQSHPVLNGLFELSCGEYRQKEYGVVLFTETEGRPEVMPLPDRRGSLMFRIPLSEFRIPKVLHERFKSEKLPVGASIISEISPPAPSGRDAYRRSGRDRDRDHGSDSKGDRGSKDDRGGKDDRGFRGDRGGKDDRGFRGRTAAARPPIVLNAFGRTPLKQNVLLSVEILKRLGVDLAILD
jgi:hypothetical protein